MGNNVNHPEHYNAGGYECIEVMEANFGKDKVQDFCLLNAFKYLWRADRKNGLEDIKKATWQERLSLMSWGRCGSISTRTTKRPDGPLTTLARAMHEGKR